MRAATPASPVPSRSIVAGSGTAAAVWLPVRPAVRLAVSPDWMKTSGSLMEKVPLPLSLEKVNVCIGLLKTMLIPPTLGVEIVPETVAVNVVAWPPLTPDGVVKVKLSVKVPLTGVSPAVDARTKVPMRSVPLNEPTPPAVVAVKLLP